MDKLQVRNLINNKGLAVRNQFLIISGNIHYFQSYQTMIAKVDKVGNVTLSKAWDYSNTTRKYLYMFLLQHGQGVLKGVDVRKRIEDGRYKLVDTID